MRKLRRLAFTRKRAKKKGCAANKVLSLESRCGDESKVTALSTLTLIWKLASDKITTREKRQIKMGQEPKENILGNSKLQQQKCYFKRRADRETGDARSLTRLAWAQQRRDAMIVTQTSKKQKNEIFKILETIKFRNFFWVLIFF